MTQAPDIATLERRYINLASSALGAVALSASDEFFGAKERLLQDSAPVFIPGKYDENGKWMDGWETRRRRDAGYDHLVLRLAVPGTISAFCIDTRHFTGNYPHAASIDAFRGGSDPGADAEWTPLLPPVALKGNDQFAAEIGSMAAWTHLRLVIFPDGGVARLRVYGRPSQPPKADADGLVDLASALSGTRVVACNDAHYGHPANLLVPGTGARMEDGWETRRRREPGNDWAILALGYPGVVRRILIDTTEFKGNFPESASIQAGFMLGADDAAVIPASLFWPELLPRQKLGPNRPHAFDREIILPELVTHVRFNIFPDGGVNRLRLFGELLQRSKS